ncbi:MAG: DUF4124 domain-containing protein [Pseudomonadota bacterium]
MRTVPLIALLMMCGLMVSTAEAQTYFKWVDEDGTTHFTAEPPADRPFERIDTTGNVIGTSDDLSFENVGDEDVDMPSEASLMPREGEPDPEALAASCAQARENMFWLQNRRRIAVENPDGSEDFVEGDDRTAMIDQTQAYLDEWCQDVPG